MPEEREMDGEQVGQYLLTVARAMLGIRVSPRSRHAVIYVGMQGDRYRFLNNKWENSEGRN